MNLNLCFKRWQSFVGVIYWREFLLCSPAILLVIVVSLDIDPLVAVIMVGAAFTVGFGASRTLGPYRWGAVAIATVGMSISAFLGSLVGHEAWLLLILVGILAACCAYLTSRNNDLWWVSLQVVVAFLVASYYPRSIEDALLRGGLILMAGFLQLLGMVCLARLFPSVSASLPPIPVTAIDRDLQWRFVWAMVLSVMGSFVVAQHWGLANDYWAPMTALMIMRPSGQLTWSRSIARLVGTLVGCSVATLIIYLFHEQLLILILALVISSGLAFSLQKANYGVLSCVMSATVVFLIALGFGDPISTTEHRLVATLLGGGVALGMTKIFRL
ncbi:FUSC family protein [Conservatibacter flavescens]|uniref:Integral membrane bound transporter domain-containing protein n=1 Tax=Conservatibacter flavescens TaxID=28161 RepID=A0A2M8RZJ7_9PAST|nr:FUSC family protein [Conservatibacter flavescens]PJG84296.1 hypothetical protein CVP05_11845 [Conservatibacter flavescens]